MQTQGTLHLHSETILEMLPKFDPNRISLVWASKETDSNPLLLFHQILILKKLNSFLVNEKCLSLIPTMDPTQLKRF